MPQAVWNGAVVADSDDTVVVNEETNSRAAWYYPTPKDAVANIRDYVASCKGNEVKA